MKDSPTSERITGSYWMQTYTGLQFTPLEPDLSTIKIADIAHALSQICRFGGHCREFYSVAQHSVIVLEQLTYQTTNRPLLLLQALIHDATEAYIGDMVRPLKCQMSQFGRIEADLAKKIHSALGVPMPDVSSARRIRRVDDCVLLAERRDLLNHCDIPWSVEGDPDMVPEIIPVSSKDAEQLFLWHWRHLQ